MRPNGYFSRISLAVCLGGFCLLSQASFAHKDLEPKDAQEAYKWADEALKDFKNVQINDQYILYSNGQANFGIALARLTKVWFAYTRQYPYAYCANWQDYAHDAPEHICWIVRKRREGERFAAAVDYMSEAARESAKTQYENQWQQFQLQAKAWRDAPVKPVMPEAAREHQVLAEYAFKEKDTEKAIAEYVNALNVFATWPEGQFNLATLAGEKKYYGLAVLHMKEYLELAPDSPDAQAAKDSIIIWKDKLSSIVAAESAAEQPVTKGKGSLWNAAARSK